MSIESATEIEEKAFKLEKTDSMNKVKRSNSRLELSIQMDRDVTKVKREVYNSFMLLGDIGGLFGLFVSVFASILGITNYQKPDNHLVSDLFKTKIASNDHKQGEQAANIE